MGKYSGILQSVIPSEKLGNHYLQTILGRSFTEDRNLGNLQKKYVSKGGKLLPTYHSGKAVHRGKICWDFAERASFRKAGKPLPADHSGNVVYCG